MANSALVSPAEPLPIESDPFNGPDYHMPVVGPDYTPPAGLTPQWGPPLGGAGSGGGSGGGGVSGNGSGETTVGASSSSSPVNYEGTGWSKWGDSYSAPSASTTMGTAQPSGMSASAAYLDQGGAIPDPDNTTAGYSQDQGDVQDASDVTGSGNDPDAAYQTLLDTLDYGQQQALSQGGTQVAQNDQSQQQGTWPDTSGSPPPYQGNSQGMQNAINGMRTMGSSGGLGNAPMKAGDDAWRTFMQPYQPGQSYSLAEGGAIPDDDEDSPSATPAPQGGGIAGAPSGGEPSPNLVAYVRGAGAMPQDQVTAAEQQVDPQGQMDPSDRAMYAIASQQDPAAQFAMMQHYRQQFNAYKAFARATMEGGNGKPADPAQGVSLMNQALDNVPGAGVDMHPMGHGVKITAKKRGGGGGRKGVKMAQGGAVPHFDDGGSVGQGVTDDDTIPDQSANGDATPQMDSASSDVDVGTMGYDQLYSVLHSATNTFDNWVKGLGSSLANQQTTPQANEGVSSASPDVAAYQPQTQLGPSDVNQKAFSSTGDNGQPVTEGQPNQFPAGAAAQEQKTPKQADEDLYASTKFTSPGDFAAGQGADAETSSYADQPFFKQLVARGYDKNAIADAADQFPALFGGWASPQDRQAQTKELYDYLNAQRGAGWKHEEQMASSNVKAQAEEGKNDRLTKAIAAKQALGANTQQNENYRAQLNANARLVQSAMANGATSQADILQRLQDVPGFDPKLAMPAMRFGPQAVMDATDDNVLSQLMKGASSGTTAQQQQDQGGQQGPTSQVPPIQYRQIGQLYKTPNGQYIWGGPDKGWLTR